MGGGICILQDFYNFLQDSGSDSISITAMESSKAISGRRYSGYLSSLRSSLAATGGLDDIMNGVIKKKLKIPENVT